MEQVTLRAHTGRATGSRESRRLRRQGQVPAVVYGHELDPINVAVDARDLYGALHTELGSNALIYLQIEDADDLLTLARVIEKHPYRNEYRHVDFVQVSLTEKVTAEVVLHFEGHPVGAEEGGVFSPRRSHVRIEALVTDIPGYIELDVSGVAIGESLRVSDLPVIENVTYLEEPDAVVMSVTVPAAEIEEPEPEVEELAEGEAAPEAEDEEAEAAEHAEEEEAGEE